MRAVEFQICHLECSLAHNELSLSLSFFSEKSIHAHELLCRFCAREELHCPCTHVLVGRPCSCRRWELGAWDYKRTVKGGDADWIGHPARRNFASTEQVGRRSLS